MRKNRRTQKNFSFTASIIENTFVFIFVIKKFFIIAKRMNNYIFMHKATFHSLNFHFSLVISKIRFKFVKSHLCQKTNNFIAIFRRQIFAQSDGGVQNMFGINLNFILKLIKKLGNYFKTIQIMC